MLGKCKAPKPRIILLSFLYTVALAVALRYLYDFAACSINDLLWLGAAIVNSVLALTFYFYLRRKNTLPQPTDQWRWLDFTPFGLLSICLVLTAISWLSGGSQTQSLAIESWAWVLWVPLVEEVTFRVGFGYYFRKKLGSLWGSYFSLLLFCLAHSVVAYFASPLMWFTHISLGVLLLGACCEFLYFKRGKVSTIVLFHMAANFSVVMFKSIDSRWLDWLGLLYS